MRWILGLFVLVAAYAQQPVPAFEVASIRANKSCEVTGEGFSLTPGRVRLPCVNLRGLILVAYGEVFGAAGVSSRHIEILGGPDWINKEPFDISAKAADPAPT